MKRYLPKILIAVTMIATFLVPISSDFKINKVEATNICEIKTSIEIKHTASDGVILHIEVIVNRPAEDKDQTSSAIEGTILGIQLMSSAPCFLNPILYDGNLNSWNAATTKVKVVEKDGKRTFPLSDDVLWVDIGESYDKSTANTKRI